MNKTIIILAKSIKNGCFCIAGKDIKTHEWIRPVSTQDGGAITEDQSKLTFEGARSSYSCKLLHQAEISFLSHVAQKYHPENYLIDGSQWIHKYNYNEDLNNLLDYPNDLWGKETKISVDTPVTSSLYFIKVSDLKLYRDYNGKRRTDFIYKNFQYKSIPCTDPSFDGRLGRNDYIFYENAFIVLSLGEPYQGFHYKLVASIFIQN